MSGKKRKKMPKRKIRSWNSAMVTKGEESTKPSKTMPDMHNDPRIVIENHVRGINPITGAILDGQRYYGDAVLPYAKDLTFEELRIKRVALEQQIQDHNDSVTEMVTESNKSKEIPKDAGTEPKPTDATV